MREITRKSLIAASILVFAVLFAEISLTTYDPFGLDYFRHSYNYFDDMEPNSGYSYMHRRNFLRKYGDMELNTNSLGLRERWIKEKSRPRLLILGDSVVFGWGVRASHRFQDKLNGMVSGYEIVSAGVGSWNTVDEFIWLTEHINKIDPDGILLVVTDNDMFFKRERTGSGLVKTLVKNTKLGALSFWIYRLWSTRHPTNKEIAATQNAILELSRFCKGQGVDLRVLLYGTKERSDFDFVLHKYKFFFELHRHKVYTLPRELFGSEYRLSRVDGHLNERGHSLLANYIYREVL